ncbi:MAG: hypothetical protein F4Y03_02280 [Alphaproteobacteria bacterium]|nr:hypothetical protein [Alphaproteobacteria bacterium]
MKLTEYLDGMRAASTADALEAAIQAPYEHTFTGPTWSRICNVRIEAGERICDGHPHGHLVPKLGKRHRLTVAGEVYRVGYGGNSAGVRYAWCAAEDWARGILVDQHGFTKRAFHAVWEWAFSYPHRALREVERALAGELPDPQLNVLTLERETLDGTPIRIQRDGEEAERRAHRLCPCDKDGRLWDWGAGWSGYAYHVAWYCDRCAAIYGEWTADLRHRRRSGEAAA